MRTLNLGILAHVDAGKTTLTERLLYAAGVIDEIGSVDDGTTQTDSLELERRRGITIRAAVVSFVIGDVTVNLIDTPGHPDFIAEVERSLRVLDGAVLVVSAVEGVQAQTYVLSRALQRLGIPTLFFVNKIDRRGADPARVRAEIAEQLTPTGTAPMLDGSAITGAGIETLMTAITEFLPAEAGDPGGLLSGSVFKVERDEGRKVAYVRMHAGTLRVRDRVSVLGHDDKVTAIRVFDRGRAVARDAVVAGEIAKVSGLTHAQVGEHIGQDAFEPAPYRFAPPTIESVVTPVHARDGARLRDALGQLAEQDPLINVRQDATEISLCLYGEVQKEVIGTTLATDYGVDVVFHETSTIYVERPLGRGAAVEILQSETHPFSANVGLRVDPAPAGSGVAFRLDVDPRSVPLHIYKTAARFAEQMTQYVDDTLHTGLFGWQVTDCIVTMTECGYYASDGPTKPISPTPRTTAADFRKLTPLVLVAALRRAGTVVCEPIHTFRLDGPGDTIGATLRVLAQLGAVTHRTTTNGPRFSVAGDIAATRLHLLQRELSGLTHGRGALEFAFDRYEPVRGAAPTRR